jgi:two-component system phosphate regulon sensor histidine kinase PhoR
MTRGPLARYYVLLGLAFAAVLAISRVSFSGAVIAASVSLIWLGWSVAETVDDLTSQADRSLHQLEHRTAVEAADLGRDRDRLAIILDNIVEAVAAVDAQGTVIALNPAFCQLFDLSPSSVGTPLLEALRHPKLTALLGEVLKGGKVKVEEIELYGKDETHFEAHAVPLLGARQRGALLILHDITRIHKLEKVRRDFVANVSHELRTPLASIRGFAETLRDGALDDREHSQEFLEAIEKDAQRLTALVDDLLDLSAIESGQRPPKPAPVRLLEVAKEAAAALRPLAERQGVAVLIKGEPGPEAKADRGQMTQVFTNLLANAIKFNHAEGSVTVTAEVEGKTVTVFVSDTGLGIPDEDLPRVFERFYRVDKARSRDMGGTGLGLAIVKHIIEAHHGVVGVQSRVGEGSVFRFTIPVG